MAWSKETNIKGPPGTTEWADITGKPSTFPPDVPIDWSDIAGQPATFPPTLPIPSSGVTGLDAKQAAQDAVDATKLDASAYTAADVLAKIKTVDGPGSGLDADLLDGQSGAYYLDNANSTGTLPAASFNDTTHGNRAGGTLHPAVTTTVNGFMSAADKVTFNAIPTTYAPLASPTFTGDPKAPTPATSDNDTSIATTAYVKANLATIVGGAIIADTPPGGPQAGQLWWESDSGALFLWYTDANTSQWVQVNNATAPGATAQARNRIVNGAMQVSQENGNAAAASNQYYAADQFYGALVTAAAVSSQRVQVVTPNGSKDRFRIAVTTGSASVLATYVAAFSTAIEGNRIADFRWGTAQAKQAILRFGWKSPAGTYSVSVQNGGQTRSYVANFTIAAGQANTDTEQIFIIPGDTTGTWATDTSAGARIFVATVVGTDRQGAAGWQAGEKTGTSANSNGFLTTGNTFELFDVGLYLDPDATGIPPKWVMPDEAEELRACQRYWEIVTSGVFAYTTGGNSVLSPAAFKTVKRIVPAAAVVSNGSTTNATAWTLYGTNANGSMYGANAVVTGIVSSYPSTIQVNARM